MTENRRTTLSIFARLPTVGRRVFFLAVVGTAFGLGACEPKAGKGTSLPPPISRSGVTRAGERVEKAGVASVRGDRASADLSQPAVRPADAGTQRSSSLRVEVRQLGAVPYDGLNLPIVAVAGGEADGEPDVWIATQTGITPPWPVLLADGSQDSLRVPGGVRVMAFHASRHDGTLRPAAWAASPPRGVIVGRSADSSGFLVEEPRPDGARWIGRVQWESGNTEWIVGGEADAEGSRSVNAFATLGHAGTMAFSRRAVGEVRYDLVVRDLDTGRERVLRSPGEDSIVFPWYSADARRVYAFALPRGGAGSPRVIAVDCEAGKELSVSAFADSRFEPTIGAAWQAATCLTTPWPAVRAGPLASGAAMFSLESGSMVWMDGASGVRTPLAKGTVGAIGASGIAREGAAVSGLMLGAAGELVFQTLERGATSAGVRGGAEVSVLRGAYIPRGAWKSGSTAGFVLLSPPVAGTGDEVGVFCAILPGLSD